MSYTKPNTPINITPKGLDSVINTINDSIRLDWLHKFNRAYLRNDKPMIREFGNVEYKDLTPNDSLLRSIANKEFKAVSFWYPDEDITANEYEISDNSVKYDRDVTLIIWANLNKLYPTNPSMTSENLINDVLKALKRTMLFEVNSITEGAAVWSDFTLPENNKYFELPYYTIGIRGNIAYTYDLNC